MWGNCLMLVKTQKDSIYIKWVDQHFKELAGFDIFKKRIMAYIEHFLNLLQNEDSMVDPKLLDNLNLSL